MLSLHAGVKPSARVASLDLLFVGESAFFFMFPEDTATTGIHGGLLW